MVTKQTLLDSLTSIQSKRVLIIGDIMLDEYHWCDVNRISPEAPVPICKVNNTTLLPGGAANVAANIISLSSEAHLIGVIGNDSSGEKLKNTLTKHHINTENVLIDPNRPTILKSRIVAHQQHIVRVDREDDGFISQSIQKDLLKKIESLLPTIDTVVLSDYLKGTLEKDFTQAVISMCNSQEKRVIIDPKGNNYSKYKNAYLIKPNFKEFLEMVKEPVETEADIKSFGTKKMDDLNLSSLLITRSEKGMTLFNEAKEKDIPTKAKEVFDITGAGDTVTAMISIGLAANLPLEHCVTLANYAAGIVVGKVGSACTTLTDIQKVIQREND